ncbi:MAG: glycosyltransferase N-terminal domain-containing protein, partial [Candidatus Poribacteria bacterium]
TVWFHAPSVGEALQALAVIGALRQRDPGVQIAFTHFSPSAARLASRMSVDVAGYLPWDLPGPIGQVLDAMSPELIVFTKTEVWPVLVHESVRRGLGVALVAGTVMEGSAIPGVDPIGSDAFVTLPLLRSTCSPQWGR